MWSSTVSAYKVIWGCHRGLTPKYRQLVAEMSGSKRVHHLKSPAEIAVLLETIKREQVNT
jgi:hypothetical protein